MTETIDITFRNVNKKVLQNFKAEAVREEKPFGEALGEAILLWLEHKRYNYGKKTRLSKSKPEDFGPGTERLSQQIDNVLYG